MYLYRGVVQITEYSEAELGENWFVNVQNPHERVWFLTALALYRTVLAMTYLTHWLTVLHTYYLALVFEEINKKLKIMCVSAEGNEIKLFGLD